MPKTPYKSVGTAAGAGVNVTKEGIKVQPGQVWRDLDKRMNGRTRTVLAVVGGKAYMGGVPKSTLSISRMHKSSTGWYMVSELAHEGDGN